MAMAFTYGKRAAVPAGVIGLLFALTLISMQQQGAMANKNFSGGNWQYNWPPYKHQNATQPKKVVVGGDDKWDFGFNYSDWAQKNGPFYLGDTLGIYLLSPAFFSFRFTGHIL